METVAERGASMTKISKAEAMKKIVESLGNLRDDQLVEVYNELFPADSTTDQEVCDGKERILKEIRDYVGRGLEIEEIVDLWNVLYPKDMNVLYDEETNTIQYDQGPVRVTYF